MSSESSHNDDPSGTSQPGPAELLTKMEWASQSECPKDATTSSSSSGYLQLPPYILKNLTPVSPRRNKRKDTSPRPRFSEQRRQKLLRRSQMIDQRIADIKKQRSALLQLRIRAMNSNYESANRRKLGYLAEVRKNAQKFLRSNTSTSTHPSLGPVCAQKLSGYLKPKVSHSRLQFLRQILSLAHFYDSIWKVPYKTAIYLMSSKEKYFLEYLTFMNIPHYEENEVRTSKPFRPLLYAFLLINDFNSFLNDGYGHPGFNSNIDNDPTERFYHNFICVLLYKFADELIHDFRRMIDTQSSQIFNKTWKSYSFLFRIFRKFHFDNVNSILEQAIEIADKQAVIFTEDSNLQDRKKRLINEKHLLKSFKNKDELNDECLDFLSSLRSNLEVVKAENRPQKHKRIINSAQTIIYGGLLYKIPEITNFLASKWRLYWFQYYLLQQKWPSPIHMKSGRTSISLSITQDQKLLDVDQILESLGEPPVCLKYSICEEYTNRSYNHLICFLKDVIKDIIAFIHNFCPTTITTDIVDRYHQISNATVANHLQVLHSYFDWIITTLTGENRLDLLGIPEECCIILAECDQLSDFVFKQIVDKVINLEHVIHRRWFEKCSFDDFQHFQEFENIYTLINAKNFLSLRPTLLTNSPNFLFPEFYQWLRSFKKYNQLNISNYVPMIEASFSMPNIILQEHKEEAFAYYKQLFVDLIIEGKDSDFTAHELSGLFSNRLKSWNSHFTRIIEDNLMVLTVTTFYSCYGTVAYSHHLDPKGLKKALVNSKGDRWGAILRVIIEALEPHSIDPRFNDLRNYCDRSHALVGKLLRQKLSQLFASYKTEGYYTILIGNFPHFARQVDRAISESLRDILYVYRVYHPLLNWIHMDLGCPMPPR
ncbi:uncharacterized protein CANTADRAFT_23574 [Suhomyces tanzawaensis NRRL Y-17324]|uniref:Uncharacterized protein n=1 Tax=Suhomyces tanzawaensis NRRL Y-17324 TaxID=984487 RepID=A0A1E4SD96_9ASCO|nr:uncharacterized protein CANTADRAFT_23574 [Suhomyces tanzawaensis NRRL Y-17324]ODV77453.1 hypothetical protein CANTADRAFT_23574 [Suhomyces tanzawaensis NRRL Y-17324]